MADDVVGFLRPTAGRIMAVVSAAEGQGPTLAPQVSGNRPAIPGFWAEITAYDAATGYAWKRLKPKADGKGLEDCLPAITGLRLFEANGSTRYSPGSRVWVYPLTVDPDGHPTFVTVDEQSVWVQIDGNAVADPPFSLGYDWHTLYPPLRSGNNLFELNEMGTGFVPDWETWGFPIVRMWPDKTNANGAKYAFVIGPVGPQGATGLGIAGAPGTQGPQGPQGTIGPAGPQGPAGANGIDGPVGANGTPGANGAQGPQGPQGTTGTTGAAGAAGATGAAGANGIDGPAGAPGTAGAQGLQGATGNTGPQGPQGTTGAAGTNGTNGTDGSNGMIGTTGPQGPQGPEGLQGIQGEIGPEGPALSATTVTIPTTFTIACNGDGTFTVTPGGMVDVYAAPIII